MREKTSAFSAQQRHEEKKKFMSPDKKRASDFRRANERGPVGLARNVGLICVQHLFVSYNDH